MNNDFRKFATQKLGMNGLVLDDVERRNSNTLTPTSLRNASLMSHRWTCSHVS